MEIKPDALPKDIEILQQMVLNLLTENEKQSRLVEKMQHQLEQLLRARFGQKADRIDPNQLALFAAEVLDQQREQDEAPVVESAQEPATMDRNRNGHGRNALPESLPRKRVEHAIDPDLLACPKCGGRHCRKIGEEVSEQLDYVPASLLVIEHARAKYACMDCEESVFCADSPMQPIEKGLPGPGLLSHVIVSKYADHLPLNRQESIFGRHGVEIPRSTQCDWMKASADLLAPLYELMKTRVLSSHVIRTDDTTVPVLDREKTKTRIGRIWDYLGDRENPYTVFDYTPSRKRDGPVSFLGDYKGYLQADAYGGYDGIYAPGAIIEVACWAHARRKFVDAQKSDAKRAIAATAYVKKLYDVEREAKGEIEKRRLEGDPPYNEECDLRRALRREKSKPLLDAFKQWLDAQAQSALPKSPIGQAIAYTLSNWAALNRYVQDGALDIDNNAAERALRAIAIGRKNWMFAGSDRGGKTAAVLYSFTQTCKSLLIDPFAYLRDILARISAHPMARLEELLPDQWKADQSIP
jgi:transposase